MKSSRIRKASESYTQVRRMALQPPMISGKIVVLLNDLMFQVKIQEAARRAGLSCIFTGAPSRLRDEATQGANLIVLDLAFSGADTVALIADLKNFAETARLPILAYVPHVNVDLRARAVSAGCDAVLARSAFVQNLPELLAKYAVPLSTDADLSLNL